MFCNARDEIQEASATDTLFLIIFKEAARDGDGGGGGAGLRWLQWQWQ